MKVEDYLKKLGFYFEIEGDSIRVYHEVFDKKDLQDNIDLLAKEMHMETELQADKSRKKIRHPAIKLTPEVTKQLLNEVKEDERTD